MNLKEARGLVEVAKNAYELKEEIRRGNLRPELFELGVAMVASYAAGDVLRRGFKKSYKTVQKNDRSDLTPFEEQVEHVARGIIGYYLPDDSVITEESNRSTITGVEEGWVVDELDGTTNYSRGIPVANFTMARLKAGKVVNGTIYDFFRNQMYFTQEGEGAFVNNRRIAVSERTLDKSLIDFAPLRFVPGRSDNPLEEKLVEGTWVGMQEITVRSERFHREFQSGALTLAWVAEGKIEGFVSSFTSPWDLSAGVLLVREAGGVATNIKGEDWKPGPWGLIAGNKVVHKDVLGILQESVRRVGGRV